MYERSTCSIIVYSGGEWSVKQDSTDIIHKSVLRRKIEEIEDEQWR